MALDIGGVGLYCCVPRPESLQQAFPIISDDKLGAIPCPKDTLNPGQSMTCTQTGIADTVAYVNVGKAEGTDPNQHTVVDRDASHYRLLGELTGAVLQDTTNNNHGDTPMSNVELKLYADTDLDGRPDGSARMVTHTDTNGTYRFRGIEPGDYVIVETQPAGYLDVGENEGGADNDAPDNHLVNAIAAKIDAGENDTGNDFVEQKAHAAISVEKATNNHDADTAATAVLVQANDPITWTYVVKNTGNETLVNIHVTDDQEGDVTCPKAMLAAGESMTCDAKHGTADQRVYENKATVEAVGMTSNTTVQESDPSHYKIQTTGNQGLCWAVDDDTKKLYKFVIDMAHPKQPVVMTMTHKQTGEGVAYRPSSNTLYMWGKEKVYIVDADTGVDKRSYAVPYAKEIEGATFYIDPTTHEEELWVTIEDLNDGNPSRRHNRYLYQVDPDSGAILSSVKIHGGFMDESVDYGQDIGGLAIDPDTRQFWITDDSGDRGVYRLNPNTGEVGTGFLLNPDHRGLDAESLAFDDQGYFYSESDEAGIKERRIWRINSQTGEYTAATQAFGTGGAGHYGDIEGMTCNAGEKYTPRIDIEKSTNDQDADTGTGPIVEAGSTVTWKYIVSNTGHVALTHVTVVDDKIGTISCPKTELAVQESMTCTQTGTAQPGQYTNVATASGVDPVGKKVEDNDTSHYYGGDASIGDYVWNDTDKDGIQDSGEQGIPNVNVHLYRSGHDTGKTVTTDAQGHYLFANLVPGDYSVKFDKPAGYEFSSQDQGSDDRIDSDVNPLNGMTPTQQLGAAEHDLTWDAGIYKKAVCDIADLSLTKEVNQSIAYGGDRVRFTVTVYNDGPAAATGVVVTDNVPAGYTNIGNPGEGVTVTGHTVTMDVGTIAANESKSFTFNVTVLEAGEHVNWAEITASNNQDPDSNVSTDHTVDDNGDGNPVDDDEDSAEVTIGAKASIGDRVWNDQDNDGIQDTGEPGIAGVKVHLYKAGADTGKTATTNSSGHYLFGNLTPGTYSVQFDKPAGYDFSPQDQGSDDAKDSDVNPADGRTLGTQLEAGEHDTDWDAGLYQRPTKADVSLTKEVNASTAYEGDRVRFTVTVKNDGPAVATGVIATDNVPSGYTAVGTPSAGATISGSTVTMHVGTLAVHAHKTFTFEATVNENGDHVNWAEVTAMNEQDPDSNVSQDHTVDDNGDGNPVDDDEDSAEVTIGAKASIGDRVWNDSNHNGIQDNNESGIEGVSVHLFQGNTDTGKTVKTDADGLYRFDNLIPGMYYLVFDLPGANYAFSPKNKGSDVTKDSDVTEINSSVNGRTDDIQLQAGEHDMAWDAGMYKKGIQGEHDDQIKLGDLIWIEDDNDGDPSTGLISYPSAGSVTIKAVKSDGSIFTAEIEENGYYELWVDENATYTVTVEGLSFLTPTAGSDDNDIDSTESDNHSHDPDGTTVHVGTADISMVDFGYQLANTAHLGDYFWIDKNNNGIQDADDEPVVGATVELLDGNGDPVDDIHGRQRVLTDDYGQYGFDVTAGKTYRIHFILPQRYTDSGYVFVSPNTGTSDLKDSDVDSTGYTAAITPVRGDIITTLDAGIGCPCSAVHSDGFDAFGSIASVIFSLMILVIGGIVSDRNEKVKYVR